MKVLIIGLDGANFDIMDDSILTKHMPNLNMLKRGGCCGVLQSTDPPLTPAAWTTCITGCQPYHHGVCGFRKYSPSEDLLLMGSALDCHVPHFWEILSNKGYKIASINVPWTYPCKEVNGIQVAGFGIPDTDVQFTYPEDFRNELLLHIPDYQVTAKWKKAKKNDYAQFEANIRAMERCFQQRLETAELIHKKITPDIMMVQFHDLDVLQHNIWPYLDKTTRDDSPVQRDRVALMFNKLDHAIGGLLKLTDLDNTHIIVVSDHGLCKLNAYIEVNTLLYQWGYLKLKSPISCIKSFLRRKLYRFPAKQKSLMPFNLKHMVEWRLSKAMVMNSENFGHLYLNVKGRSPYGTVEPGVEYDSIIEEICSLFSTLTDSVTGKKLFNRVVTPSDLFNREITNNGIFGDIILIPNRGYELNQKISKDGDNYIQLMPKQSLWGCHSYEGLYIVYGPNIKKGNTQQASIADIVPTIYAILGVDIPKYLDGSPLQYAFKNLKIQYQSSEASDPKRSYEKHRHSDKEQEAIQKMLSELGYME